MPIRELGARGSASGLSESSRQPETTIRRDLSRVSMRRFCENFEPQAAKERNRFASIRGYIAEPYSPVLSLAPSGFLMGYPA